MFNVKLINPQIDLAGGNTVYEVKYVREKDLNGINTLEFLICDDIGNFQWVLMDNCYCAG